MSNPFHDLFEFLQRGMLHGRLPIYVFIALLIASVVIAVFSLVRNPEQRTSAKIYTWLARLFVGGMWYRQMLWKMPPTRFGDRIYFRFLLPAMGAALHFAVHLYQ